jgi:regulator of protease activity HflC (stomatin/prohibitin superfamily)
MNNGTSFLDAVLGFIFSWNLLAVIVVLVLLLGTFVMTPGKRAKIIERLGKPLETARMPGLSLKIPFFDRVVGIVNTQLQEIGADVSIKTKDNAFMTLPVKVQYRASDDPAGAVRAHYELENPELQITSYVLNNARQTASSMEMVDLYQNRDMIEKQVQEALQVQFVQYGYTIENVLVDEPQPSPEVRDAFNRVIASLREKEAAQNIADAKRIELVGVAQAEKESKKLQGEGMAAMRDAIATGLEDAVTKLSTVMSREQALTLLMDTNRLDTLGSAAAHGNMVLVDMQGGGDFAKTIAAVKVTQPDSALKDQSGPKEVTEDAA